MTPEAWTVVGVGVALGALGWRAFGTLDTHVRAQGERLARLEGKVDTLIAAFVKPPTTG